MVTKVKKGRKAIVSRDDCVACGACAKVCPVTAITIYKGIYANVNFEICVGCTKCSLICPAHAISMEVPE
ncbi:MAG: 4Fe-4S binding protein [Synergistaceae bacterium]|jgi:formate hydrogenlyase subunit 6/NADH:ubiquinone oxidoreductase subunit I|nr:4Fe-4S binding protein [Synergistaceae bacterium]